MTTAGPLTARSKKELADMARRKGVRGWDTMSKDDLLKALARAKAKPAAKPAKAAPKVAARPTKPVRPARPAAKPAPKVAAKVTRPAKPSGEGRGGSSSGTPTPLRGEARGGSSAGSPTPSVGSRGGSSSGTPMSPRPAVNGTHRPAEPARPAAPKPVAPTPTNRLPAATPAPKPVPVAPKPVAATPKPLPVPVAPRPQLPPAPLPVAKDLSAGKPGGAAATKDRVLLMVPDPYWLHAYWELTTQSVQRAEAALKQDWHGARPVIRLFDVTSTDTTSTSETPVRDIFIQGGCNNWYIDIPQPPRSYRADIGYLSRRGEFYVLARSNVVQPPKAGSTEAIDVGWSDLDSKKAERVLAMSSGFETAEGDPELKRYLEEKLRRPMGAPKDTAFGTGAVPPASIKKFFFELDAKLVVFGRTDPTAHVTLQNEPIKLAPDGTFVMWFSLPDSRQIIPAVATSADGVEERTIVLAVERNTKHLDPMIHDQMNEV